MDRDLPQAASALARRPGLWGTAARAGVRHLPRRGRGARAAEPWLRFRIETAYGRERSTPTGADLVTWLRWLRSWPRARG
ncbi:hypothetical protein HC251_10320 [Iamia sp. SCSIO 61187]|uniref:hypothetical protein n=1 Tax=Iamia sp. SCSIO 61187 TaxID=2722752 RepID=UPI001C635AF8|nr:hypothetical protein [Iamia sp. SCSIO 61187]QYG92784.1 hypothetical protein HC251_10320 [Iamia sp. SCSIO 61187]